MVNYNNIIKKHNKYAQFYEYKKGCFSMVYLPKKPLTPHIGLFLFNAGHRYRTGMHDIYVKIGINLSMRGIYVITTDPKGIGDDFRGLKFKNTQEHQYYIQKEGYVNDAIIAINFFRKELVLDKIICSGLCGGTRTAIACAAKTKKVDKIFAWACPFQLSNNPRVGSYNKIINEKEFSNNIESIKKPDKKSYLKKMFTLKIDWKFQYSKIKRKLYACAGKDMSFDYKSAKQIKKCHRKNIKLIFLYSEKDFHYEIFRDFYLPLYGEKLRPKIKTIILKETNHVVGDKKSLKLLVDHMHTFCTDNI